MRMDGRLAGRIAFISGGGGGIGRAAALAFAREGAAVAVADIDAGAGEATARAVRDLGGHCIYVQADVTQDDSVRAAVAAAVAALGPLSVLFNAAGGSDPDDVPLPEADLAVVQRTIDLDLKGTMLCCRHAIPHLVAAGGGAVVNMSSGAALRGSNPAHAYTAAKGAIVSLTRALAGTYARHNVRVNAICAGRVNTERIRTKYGIPGRPGQARDRMNADEQVRTYPFWFGEPEDVASIALFLASDESRMITGAAIPADGGRSAY
jgi:NAD(P)-dependent dehydrogenase (short-subunit alcohol dehydrogenase family)